MRDLLPQNRGSFEAAFASALEQRFDVSALEQQKLRTLFDPWHCPETHLPLLAWAWSVDIWDETWSTVQKREVIATARRFHILKTTVSGFRMALGYVGAKLVRAHTPKEGFFLGGEGLEQVYASQKKSLPELRIYNRLSKPSRLEHAQGRKFLGHKLFIAHFSQGVLDLYQGEYLFKEERKPLLFTEVYKGENGETGQVPLKVLIPYPVQKTLKIPGFLSRPVRQTPYKGFFWFSELGALSPPQKTFPTQDAGKGFFIDRPRRGRKIRTRLIPKPYLSFRVREKAQQKAGVLRNVLGKTRLRRAPFTVALLAHIVDPLPRRSKRFLRQGPELVIQKVEKALCVTKAVRDTVSLSLNSVRPLVFSDLKELPDHATYGTSVFN